MILTYDNLTVRAVLNETLRLFPPVPLNMRESRVPAVALPPSRIPAYTLSENSSRSEKKSVNTGLNNGNVENASDNLDYKPFVPVPDEPLYMPGSTPIMYMPLLMQRNPDLWGPDADVFDPERFLDPKNIAKIASNPMMFIPFSAGPRIVSHRFFHPSSPMIANMDHKNFLPLLYLSEYVLSLTLYGPRLVSWAELRVQRSFFLPCEVATAI